MGYGIMMTHYKTEKTEERLWLGEEEFSPLYELKTESVFAQCNGYIGVRAAHPFSLIEERRGMFLCGAFNKAYAGETVELVNCPDVSRFELEVDGEKIYPERSQTLSCSRRIDLLSGELEIRYEIRLESGSRIRVENRRFASMDNIHLFVQLLQVQVLEGNVKNLKIKTGLNGQMTNSGVSHFRSVTARVYEKEAMELQAGLQDDTVTEMTQCIIGKGRLLKKGFELQRRSIYGTYEIEPDADRIVCMEKLTYIGRKTEENDVDKRTQIINAAREKGYNLLFEEHKQVMLGLLGRLSVHVDGATPEEEAAFHFAWYHILGMVPWHTSAASIAAKGLTGEGYKGHVFWDTELFVFPPLLYTYPEAAKRLLEFRYNGLSGARKKAKERGYEGAMFPWEAAKSGEEETPPFAALNIHTGKANEVWSGIKENHVTADIIYALAQYYDVTGDREFMEACGYTMAFEAAKFWASFSEWDDERGKYVIRDIIGPDEYTEHVDNNAYTNYMAAYCVKTAYQYALACKNERPDVYDTLNKELDIEAALPIWKEFGEKIYLPVPNEDMLIPQDDTFLSKPQLENIEKYKLSPVKQSVLLDYSRDEVVGMQVLKQADVVMLLNLFPFLFSENVVKRNVLFYESRTIHDSSLSYCAHAQACASIGEIDLAYRFFQKSLLIDIDDNPFDSTDGIHSASLGGVWNCMISGFAGARYEKGRLYLDPKLPKHWKGMRFFLMIEGILIKFNITKESLSMKREESVEKAIHIKVIVDGREYSFKEKLTVELGI